MNEWMNEFIEWMNLFISHKDISYKLAKARGLYLCSFLYNIFYVTVGFELIALLC